MEGRREVGFPRLDAHSLREQAARTVLRNVRLQGHHYVELREDKKRNIFFCTLCLAPCYSDSVLFDHLKGNLHTERLAAAKATLMEPNNPWPFNDGVVFFEMRTENGKEWEMANEKQQRLLGCRDNQSLAIVKYDGNSKAVANESVDKDDYGDVVNSRGVYDRLLIPDVLIRDNMSDLFVRCIGMGQIAARFLEKGEALNGISRIWCEWLGKVNPEDDDLSQVPRHDFAILIFAYNYSLGRKSFLGDTQLLLSSNHVQQLENGVNNEKKRKKSLSDPEDMSESLSNQYDSSVEDSSGSNGSPRLLLDRYDDQVLNTRIIPSKAIRRELRRHQRLAAEIMCDICQQKMLPGKHVSTLLNMKTGRLACSSRNLTGSFHLFHTSCLIHWMLLCEYEINKRQLAGGRVKRKGRKKNGVKCTKLTKDAEKANSQFDSVFCPECQGTGSIVEGDNFENPVVTLSEMFRFKIKVSDGRRAWMKSPETLKNCSVGFHFPTDSDGEVQEKVLPRKLLHFYGAVEHGFPDISS